MSNSSQHSAAKKPGVHSLAEILSQPACWSECLKELKRTGKLEEIRDQFADATEWLFIGCGSSFYVGLSAAATMTMLTGLRARAVPASEVLLYPDITLSDTKCVPVLISRSGQTSEVLRAAELLNARGIQTVAISCTSGQALERLATNTIVLSGMDEKSIVMTQSFSSMLLTLQVLAATIAGNAGFVDAAAKMATSVAATLKTIPARIEQFVGQHDFADYVYLGQGPFYGLACEGALKVTEMSVSYAQAFHTLEFRHGPKSIVAPETLLVFLLSEAAYQSELEMLEEVKSLGGTTLVITNRADARARAASDCLVELSLEVPEAARLAPTLFSEQLVGLYTGLKKGLDPDTPRNLTRAVILAEEDPSKKPEHAAI